MKQKLLTLGTVVLLATLMTTSALADQEEEVPVGTRLGNVYTTDIVTFIDGAPIASYNADGTTMVSVSDLANYGFQVDWDQETRTASILAVQRPEHTPNVEIRKATPGKVSGGYYSTDVQVSFNGAGLDNVCSINGWTMIPLSEIGAVQSQALQFDNPNYAIGYSRFLGATTWDAQAREVHFSSLHPGDTLEVNGITCTVDSILPANGAWTGGIVQYVLLSRTPGEDPEAHWDAKLCSTQTESITSLSAIQGAILDDQLSIENNMLVLRNPVFNFDKLSRIAEGPQPMFNIVDSKVTLRRFLYPMKHLYPGCAAVYLSVPFLLEQNGQVIQTEIGGTVLGRDGASPNLCLNLDNLLELLF